MAELVYGISGSGKTTWICKLIEHFVSKGKKARVYIGDGGGQTYLDWVTLDGKGLFDEGLVEIYQYTNRENPFETVDRICQGFWPENVEDPKSKLEAPDYAKYKNEYGITVFEGLNSIADYLMGYQVGGLSEQSGRAGIKLGGGLDAPFKVTDGSVTLGGVSQSGYGFIQRVVKDAVQQTRVIPGLVYWTAHQKEVDDFDNRATMIGPMVAGKALTSTIGASFGNTIHLDSVAKTFKKKDPTSGKEIEQIKLERRAYWAPHYDPDGKNFTRYYANVRVMADRIAPEYREVFEQGWMTPPEPLLFYKMLASGKTSGKTDKAV